MRGIDLRARSSRLGVMRVAWLLGGLLVAGCNDLTSLVSGSCDGTQTVAGMTVQLCTESPSETLDQQGTLDSLCHSGQLGTAAGSWQQGTSCPTSGTVGGCQRTTDGITVVSWVYPGSTHVNAAAVQAFCAQAQATYVAP